MTKISSYRTKSDQNAAMCSAQQEKTLYLSKSIEHARLNALQNAARPHGNVKKCIASSLTRTWPSKVAISY